MKNTKTDATLKPILVLLPDPLIQTLNEIAISLKRSRSDVIRESLTRDVKYLLEHEVPAIMNATQAASSGHSGWLQTQHQQAKATSTSATGARKLKTFKQFWCEQQAAAADRKQLRGKVKALLESKKQKLMK